MSGRLPRLVRATALAVGAVGTVGAVLVSALPPAAAAPAVPAVPAPDERSVAELLTGLQRLYRETEEATETYNATEEKLNRRKAEVARLNGRLAAARLSLRDSRGAAGRLARQQYQGASEISPYLRLLFARDPQHALDQGHVIRRVSRERAGTVERLAVGERRAAGLARRARTALDGQLALAERQKKDRDLVRERLEDVEELLASLTEEQLSRVAELERSGVAEAQDELVASGALSSTRRPSRKGERALRHAVEQIGKPYEWGAEGPDAYDCSGLTSQAWGTAGHPIPRTSQEQWSELPRIALTDLRPGDLVVYFPKATHVAIYLGDGLVVQAPRPHTRIKVSPVAANPVLGAVRPDPSAASLRRYTPPKLPKDARAGSDEGNDTP
ncbi:C40 family peptidase [Streptomyces beigongshangae]|uniref:C40 family peptidase n=1 Tax=Streptomyces beigongshangae TaxID=2841597 RepID=UPI001C864429|nr:C40 family peptidase [Streptomyces sp. REN17]